jgi:GntR family transcriptional regulator/MocR family aminotransferase
MMSAQPSYLNANCAGEFIFGYSELTQEQIQKGISRLAQAIAK